MPLFVFSINSFSEESSQKDPSYMQIQPKIAVFDTKDFTPEKPLSPQGSIFTYYPSTNPEALHMTSLRLDTAKKVLEYSMSVESLYRSTANVPLWYTEDKLILH